LIVKFCSMLQYGYRTCIRLVLIFVYKIRLKYLAGARLPNNSFVGVPTPSGRSLNILENLSKFLWPYKVLQNCFSFEGRYLLGIAIRLLPI